GQSTNVNVTVNNADTTIPTVAISSPSAGATVSGTVAVSASATDNIGVSRVEFYVNNVLQSTDTTAPYSYSWNTTAVANGSYTLSAKAYDAAGNSAQANLVVNVFNDLTAPVLSLNQVTSPTTLTTQTLSGSVSDNNAVASVTVQVGAKVPVAATISGNSWSFGITGLVVGVNSIIVRATDPAGNSTSLTATVTVESPSSPLSLADAISALQIAVGKITPSSDQQSRLDVAPVINGVSVPNGKVDTGDAIVILSKIVGKIVF
ncbi:MAG: Ig-like domain-containing protein, partial [Geobacter sp.]|nr:Ig-like domain-containing protein [Geobacter sp.]